MSVLESRLSYSVKSLIALVAWVAVAVALLTGMSLGIAWLVTLFRGGSALAGDYLYVGIVCCLIALLFVGVFHLRKETVQLRVSDREKFQTRIQRVLEDLGYHWTQVANSEWRGRPRFRSLLFGDGITMKLNGYHATLSGPRLSLELVRRRYRMVSHMDKVQQSITDSRSRVAETYLKRLELSLRLEPEHMAEFQSKILDVLADNGNVLVDVQVMLISADGMKESLWTREMRPWLEENRIHYEFHRDHTQRATIGALSGDSPSESFIDTCVWS